MSLTLMVFFSAGISVLAETIEQKDVDVTAQYIQTAEGFNQAPVKNGDEVSQQKKVLKFQFPVRREMPDIWLYALF